MKFPFGEPVKTLKQRPLADARVFILGVYASAVHARWYSPRSRVLVQALAVASEPEMFWTGDGAPDIVGRITLPPETGYLLPADPKFNGPSGRTLDSRYLYPMGESRQTAWLCDLLPESRVNPAQQAAIRRHYDPWVRRGLLPPAECQTVPRSFVDRSRREDIADEFLQCRAPLLVTLGDQPLREFAAALGFGRTHLRDYGMTPRTYGRRHEARIGGHHFELLPLVHPRQAAQLGLSSNTWTQLHLGWIASARSAT